MNGLGNTTQREILCDFIPVAAIFSVGIVQIFSCSHEFGESIEKNKYA